MDNFGGRKFIGFILVSVLLLILALAGKVTGDMFMGFITANFGIFVTGNVAENIAK